MSIKITKCLIFSNLFFLFILGNVYVKSVTPSGPAAKTNQIQPGDQIISVNGHTLLNLKYNKALELLQNAREEVEIIFLQSVNNDTKLTSHNLQKEALQKSLGSTNMVSKLLRGESFSKLSAFNPNAAVTSNSIQVNKHKSTSELFNNDLLNVEALKTINVLLALTKRNLERKNSQRLQNTGNDLTDPGDSYKYSSSTESTPSKHKKINQDRRRPLSVHLSEGVDLFDASADNNLSNRTRSCDNITVLKGNTSYITDIDLSSNDKIGQNQKISTISRRWTGHIKYPVTPSKLTASFDNKTSQNKQFIYGNSLSDEEQIFI